ncbi:hypothetical protein Tco_0015456 [Tanacetum coccineum]
MFVTMIAWSFGLLTNEMVSVLNREPPPHVYSKTSLVKIGVIMELYEGECCWPATREVVEEGEGDDEEGDGEGGTKELEAPRISTMGQQDERAYWMYNHIVCQFQYISTRDNLNPHLQIDMFQGYEADYPPIGYQGYMPPGYAYRPDPLHDRSS